MARWGGSRSCSCSSRAPRPHPARYDGILELERSFAAWISDDPSRVPLRFELGADAGAGAFIAELVTYQDPPDRRP